MQQWLFYEFHMIIVCWLLFSEMFVPFLVKFSIKRLWKSAGVLLAPLKHAWSHVFSNCFYLPFCSYFVLFWIQDFLFLEIIHLTWSFKAFLTTKWNTVQHRNFWYFEKVILKLAWWFYLTWKHVILNKDTYLKI